MIKIALGTTLGLLFGAVTATVVAPCVGMAGFSGSTSAVVLGYVCSLCVGGTAGLRKSGWPLVPAAGAMIGLLVTYVLRSVPLPWLNLVWLDGTAGPAGELPFVVLPVVGMLVGGVSSSRT